MRIKELYAIALTLRRLADLVLDWLETKADAKELEALRAARIERVNAKTPEERREAAAKYDDAFNSPSD